jgi:SAM-dependent methyltransferase
MKQNIYDDPEFFAKYVNYRKSPNCLNSALEQPYLHNLLPSLNGKRILDIGSGMGLFCKYALEKGASFVAGVDISSRMCAEAESLLKGFENVLIINSSIEDFNWEEAPFDLIVSSLALHYVKNVGETVKRTSAWLKKSEYYIASMNHPVYTATLSQTNGNGSLDIKDYWSKGARVQTFLGTKIVKYHETLEGYFQIFSDAGLQINTIKDLSPYEIGIDVWEGDEGLARRPIFMLIKAQKG